VPARCQRTISSSTGKERLERPVVVRRGEVARIGLDVQSVASAVLYSGASPASGKTDREHAAVDDRANVSRIRRATKGRPVRERETGQRDHRVAPQSPNQ